MTTKYTVTFAFVVQLLCLWILRESSRLATQAYQVVVPDLALPRLTEIAMHTGFIITGLGAAFIGLLGFVGFSRIASSAKAWLVTSFVTAELVVFSVVGWAYLLPFGYMMPKH